MTKTRKPTRKQCTTCTETLPLSSFQRNARSRTGRRAECGPCHNRYRRERYRSDPEYAARHRAQSAATRVSHPEGEQRRNSHRFDDEKWSSATIKAALLAAKGDPKTLRQIASNAIPLLTAAMTRAVALLDELYAWHVGDISDEEFSLLVPAAPSRAASKHNAAKSARNVHRK